MILSLFFLWLVFFSFWFNDDYETHASNRGRKWQADHTHTHMMGSHWWEMVGMRSTDALAILLRTRALFLLALTSRSRIVAHCLSYHFALINYCYSTWGLFQSSTIITVFLYLLQLLRWIESIYILSSARARTLFWLSERVCFFLLVLIFQPLRNRIRDHTSACCKTFLSSNMRNAIRRRTESADECQFQNVICFYANALCSWVCLCMILVPISLLSHSLHLCQCLFTTITTIKPLSVTTNSWP